MIDNYFATISVLFHDLKPKLTGLKTDEHEVQWGNDAFVNPWVTGAALQEQFRLWANALLQGNEDIQAIATTVNNPIEDLRGGTLTGIGSQPINSLLIAFFGLLSILGIACELLRRRR